MTPPSYDPSNILVWKTRMSIYLQTLGLHTFLAATKKCYLGNLIHIRANAQALEAIRSTLPKDYLLHVSNIDSAFVVWNKLTTTTTTSELQEQIQEEESSGESEPQCFMVQGNDSLEVHSESHLDSDDACSSCDDIVDPHALNEELSIVCEKLIENYKILKKKSLGIEKENKDLHTRLDIVLQEKVEVYNERDSLRSQLELALKENNLLKSKNDCNEVLKNNDILSSKVEFVLKENDSLKREIVFISKELEICLSKNNSLKNDMSSHVYHASVASSSRLPNACTSSSKINDDICMLKKKVDCLGSTMSQCAMNHTRLETLLRKKQVPSFMHAHPPRHTHAPHGHHHTYAHVYTCTHCGRKGHLAKFCFDRLHVNNLANKKKFVWVRDETNSHGPKRQWVPKTTPPIFDVGVDSHMT